LSRGLKARLEEGKDCWELYIYAGREETKSAIKIARDGEDLLHLFQLEALAQTIKSLGEKPSQGLLEAISAARSRDDFNNNGGLPLGLLNGSRFSNQN
jgi:hypothetical protein